jgi:putative ABC transport system permease protein
LLRLRWRAWTGLAIVLGVFAGVVMALAIGAHRSSEAYPRFVAQQRAADVILAGQSAYTFVGSLDLDEVDKMRSVVTHAHAFAVLPFSARVDNGPLLGNADLFAVAAANEQLGHSVEKWKVLSGRFADPHRAEEATASFELAERLHLHVGSTVRFHFYKSTTFAVVAARLLTSWGPRLDELARTGNGGFEDPADGPSLDVKVVGIEASPLEFPPLTTDLSPVLHLTPAFERIYAKQIAGTPIDYVRLAASTDLATFQQAVEQIANRENRPAAFISTLNNQQPKVQRSIRAESIVLATLAALVAFAGAVALAQALARQAYAEARDDPTLYALGMERGQMFAVAVLRSAYIGAVAAVVACLLAWRLAPQMMLSLARKANLEHGYPVYGTAFAIGAAAVFAFTLLVGSIVALFIARTGRNRDEIARERSSRRFGASFRAAWVPVSAALGARFALQRARRSAPAWTAIAGIALCLGLLTFASTFVEHLRRDLTEKDRYGWNWDVKIGAPALPDIADPIAPSLRAQPGVVDLSVAAATQAEVDNARVDVLGIDQIVGNAIPTIAEGRVPRAPDEIALGSRTLRHIEKRVGDTVSVRIGRASATYRVVGRAIFPEFGDSGQLGTGALLTVKGLWRVSPKAPRDTFLVGFDPATDAATRAERLSAVLGPLPAHNDARPQDLVNLSRGDGLLVELVLLLMLLAVAMLVHVLVTSVRSGRREHATLRALGYTRAQSRATVWWQSVTLALAAFVVGAPFGLVLGRAVWSTYATRLGLEPDGFIPLTTVAIALGAVAGIAFLAAIVPSWLVNRSTAARDLQAAD